MAMGMKDPVSTLTQPPLKSGRIPAVMEKVEGNRLVGSLGHSYVKECDSDGPVTTPGYKSQSIPLCFQL